MKSKFTLILAALTIVISAQNMDQWRGNGRTGIYRETGLLEEWPESGPEMVWHFDELGKGFSSVIVHDGRIYLTGMEESEGFLYCLDLKGKLLWKKGYGKEWSESFPGVRTTPTYSDGKLYLISTFGIATCFDALNGEIAWQKNVMELYGAQQLKWGITESPIIVDDKVIFTTGGTKATMVAFNKNNGEVIWENSSFTEKSAFCSPMLCEINGKKTVVTCIEKNVIGVDAASGKLLWNFGQENRAGVHPNTPFVDGNNVYSVTGYGKGSIMFTVAGDNTTSLDWENNAPDSQMGGFIMLDGRLYASGQNNKAWQCVDAKTGKILYSNTEIGNGAIISNNGLLYTYSQNDGTVCLIKPEETGFQIKGKFKVELGADQHWAHPVICGGIIYIRHGNVLMAYNIKK